MTEIAVNDEGGDTIKMIDFGEYRSSFNGRSFEYLVDVHRKLPTFKFRDDDVLLVSYPKAGCTWTFEILTMLLNGKPEGPKYSKMDAMLEASSQDNLNSFPSPRILNTHQPLRRIPADINNTSVKIVFVVRNPKDAAVSLYNMMYGMGHWNYKGTFSNWLPLFIRGELPYERYPRFHLDWEKAYHSKQYNMLLVYFEDMKKDCLCEIKRMANFLDVNLDDGALEAIATKCQFKEMKTRYTKQMLGTSVYRDGTNYEFLRKGEVGNWKDWMTVAQSEMVDDVIKREMSESQLNMVYEIK